MRIFPNIFRSPWSAYVATARFFSLLISLPHPRPERLESIVSHVHVGTNDRSETTNDASPVRPMNFESCLRFDEARSVLVDADEFFRKYLRDERIRARLSRNARNGFASGQLLFPRIADSYGA